MTSAVHYQEDHESISRSRADALLLRLLSQVHLFSGFHRTDLLDVLRVMDKNQFQSEEYIFHEGDLGDYLYVLISGEVQVLKGQSEIHEIEIAKIQPGETFGEMALVEHRARSASIRTMTPCTVLRLNGTSLAHLPKVTSKLHLNIAKLLANRLRVSNEIILSLLYQTHSTTHAIESK